MPSRHLHEPKEFLIHELKRGQYFFIILFLFFLLFKSAGITSGITPTITTGPQPSTLCCSSSHSWSMQRARCTGRQGHWLSCITGLVFFFISRGRVCIGSYTVSCHGWVVLLTGVSGHLPFQVWERRHLCGDVWGDHEDAGPHRDAVFLPDVGLQSGFPCSYAQPGNTDIYFNYSTFKSVKIKL